MSYEICIAMKLENTMRPNSEGPAKEFRLTLEAFGNYQRPLISLGMECLDLFERVNYGQSRKQIEAGRGQR